MIRDINAETVVKVSNDLRLFPVMLSTCHRTNYRLACRGCDARMVGPDVGELVLAADARGWRDGMCRGCGKAAA